MNKNIQNMMIELFGHSCLCYSYAYLASKTTDIKTLTRDVLEGWYMGYIDDDGYVSNPVKYLGALGLKCKDIAKVSLTKLSDLPNDNNYVVEYQQPNGKGSHFVVANRQEGVVFDPSGSSLSVKNGKILSYRAVLL